MQFETRRVAVETQIKLIDRIMDEYRSMLRVFDGPHDDEIRRSTTEDIIVLSAARHSLMRLGTCETAVEVPNYARAVKRRGNAIL